MIIVQIYESCICMFFFFSSFRRSGTFPKGNDERLNQNPWHFKKTPTYLESKTFKASPYVDSQNLIGCEILKLVWTVPDLL